MEDSVPQQEMMGEISLLTDYSHIIHSLVSATLAKSCSRASGFAQ